MPNYLKIIFLLVYINMNEQKVCQNVVKVIQCYEWNKNNQNKSQILSRIVYFDFCDLYILNYFISRFKSLVPSYKVSFIFENIVISIFPFL